MSDTSRLKATVYIGGLDNAVTQQTLHAAFIPFGDIVDISLPKPDLPSSTDPHRGFGYVEFESPEDAKEAIDNMDQSELFGRVIRVAQAKPQKDQSEGLGSKTAIWQQVCLRSIDFSERLRANDLHRRAGWQKMLSATMIVQLQNNHNLEAQWPRIQCKVSMT
jgi:RNA recognition motif-containing protein